jgi:hypothetical protein
MKQLLTLVFAAGLLICAQQPPPPTVTASYPYYRYQAGDKTVELFHSGPNYAGTYKIGLKGDISLQCATRAE